MERPANPGADQHVVDIPQGEASPAVSVSRNVSRGGGDSPGGGGRRRSPLNSGLWISIELVVNLCQIVAAIVVLSVSKNEHPQAPLFTWVVGYMTGCFLTLPHLYWRYATRMNRGTDQVSSHLRRSSSHDTEQVPSHVRRTSSQNNSSEVATYSAIEEDHTRAGRNSIYTNARFNTFVNHFKMALDCFFAVWFVIGNVWVFGGRSSATDAPNLHRLCLTFLAFSFIGYAMPFILCGMLCCCLPCIISIVGIREDPGQTKGATSEVINALPFYKYKSKRNLNGEAGDSNSDGPGEDGILAAGTDKERSISAEDAVCCICLAKYANNDDIRELPCSHFFHMECVDKWLKISALCPLCKYELADPTASTSNPTAGPPPH